MFARSVHGRVVGVVIALSWLTAQSGATEIALPGIEARFERGALVHLVDGQGRELVRPVGEPAGAALRREQGDHRVLSVTSETRADGSVREETGELDGLPGARLATTYVPTGDEIALTQTAESPEPGVWGVEWAIERIPLDMNVLVPNTSGIRLTANSPGANRDFDYPTGWECQLVIVQGEGFGFWVWAEDAEGRFKRLRVERDQEGWRLVFTTMPYAPFADKTACDSVRWRIGTYEGDWRVPAKRYRDWAETAFNPVPVEEQEPAWVADIRATVIVQPKEEMLDVLVEHVDPTRTLLYVPDWREAGYDRDYPTYDAPRPGVKAFIGRAHALGFRVMLHVNYFGCDPLHPVYATFAPYHIRSPWGAHDREWWLWERAEPVIKFAYINPAYKPWRDLFVSRMVELHALLNPDAYHLDQTLVIYNDHNGLINGMSMIDGSIALHRELREALPQVALSGEGLNEVAYRYEAFAQRHASGIDHTTGTHDIGQLRTAHPIAAYLMLPYTANYGYLGFAPPWNGQLYSAWNEAYAHWGVLPTLAYAPQDLAERPGFTRQLLDEIAFFQTEAPAPDLDGPWPEEVVFPYRTADGTRAVRTADRVLRVGEREIARTITGVTQIALPGTIPGWVGFNREALIGLDPTLRYPYFDQPRAYDKLHVALLPEGFTVDGWALHDGLAFARLGRTAHGDIRFGELLYSAETGTRLLKGGGISARGELNGADGGRFTGSGDMLSAHPPYLNGTGETFARFDVTLPDDAARFVGEPAIGMGAVGEDKSDGATFSVTVRADGQEARAELHHATEERGRLELDVSAFAGRRAEIELAVGPGPDNDPSFDWAQWHRPRIERGGAVPGAMRLHAPGAWTLALHGRGAAPLAAGTETVTAEGLWPGACYLLAEAPEPARLPLAMNERAFVTTYLDEQGAPWPNAPYGAAGAQTAAIAGTERSGLSAHPPANGRTIMDFPMALPDTPARFTTHVALRDDAKSNGVIFRVEANGVLVAEARVRPDEPADLAADLSPWVGAPVVLSLITDADGDADYDWAFWCEPVLTTAE